MVAIKSWMERSQEYFGSLNQNIIFYAQYVDILVKSYSGMAYFYSNLSNKCKTIKRGIDLFEELNSRLDEDYYMHVCRDVWYNLGELYAQMVEFKMKLLNGQETMKPKQVSKIKALCQKSIFKYQTFISTSTEDDEQLILAYFHCGNLFMILIPLNSDFGPNMMYKFNAIRYFEIMQEILRDADESIRKRLKVQSDQCNENLLALALEWKTGMGSDSD